MLNWFHLQNPTVTLIKNMPPWLQFEPRVVGVTVHDHGVILLPRRQTPSSAVDVECHCHHIHTHHDSMRWSNNMPMSISTTVWVKKSPPPIFSDIFSKMVGIFSPYFTHLLYVPIYTILQIVIQLSPTLTKLRHIKRDHHYMLKMSTISWNVCWMVALNMA